MRSRANLLRKRANLLHKSTKYRFKALRLMIPGQIRRDL
jgi:hypothetical protein